MSLWRFGVAGVFILLVGVGDTSAGFGLYSVGTKVGLDVVQANDTRHFYGAQADIATIFTPKLRLEVAGEMGYGRDLDDTKIRVIGGGLFFRYLWGSKSGKAFAYMGGGVGGTRIRRFSIVFNEYQHENQMVFHFIPLGMEKHVFQGRAKGIFEVRWVLGDAEDVSSLRVAVGIGLNIGKPK